MRVIPLHRESDSDYSCVSYWILGDHNEVSDRNTLIDVGSRNPENLAYFLREMAPLSKGIGKMAVEQVVLTHDHFDHSGGLSVIERQFRPKIWSWFSLSGGNEAIEDGMRITVGDEDAFLLHTPGHSDDSICVYMPAARALFSGDTLYRITDTKGSYSHGYLRSLERLAALDIQSIFPGHGLPLVQGAMDFIRAGIANVSRSIIEG